ncbi:uncharacterized protein LOC127712217 isoform X1 [Mytilus californianus]|uniref:uncharacterized protein LOC127712217 isoform X1 n=1 Tax=Mytilus californianus TaxID=6549 RepID=UPI0022470A3B|nr:uncharacterized protein LOC127712217 isoform X1 [Mytilus californianus]XP_052074489.1 uncharacterized protein LOC127712217 isoform X1 [Mytilus californianus]XP_052074490.1 uncharacterized protein LOC127712217 isoform X1 [Mytilus californianus]
MDYNITIPEYSQDLSKHMYQLQQTGVLCDVWLVCKDGVVFVHKLVLMACGSAYLQQQLSADTSSSSQCQVFLKDYSLKTVYDFVQALYTGSFTLCHDRAIDILKLCTFLDVTVFTSTIQGIVENDPNLKREFEKGGKRNNMNRIFYEVEIAKDPTSAPFKVPVKVQKSNIIMERIVDNSLKTKDIFSQSSVESPRRNRILVIKSDTTENTKRKNNTEATYSDGCIPKKQTRVSKQTRNVVQTSPNIFPPQTKLEKETPKNVANSPCCSKQSDHTYEADNTKELLNIAKSLSTSADSACIELSDIDENLPTLSDGTISELDKSKTLLTSTDMRRSGKDGEQQESCQLCQKVSEDAVEKKNGQYICKGCVSLFNGENSQTNGEKKKKGRKGKKEIKMKRKHYRGYNPSAMAKAYKAVIDDKLPVHSAAKSYGVPSETLEYMVAENLVPVCSKLANMPIFTSEEENIFMTRLMEMDELGYVHSRQEMANIATDYAIVLAKKTKDSPPLSLTWFQKMLRRWPDFKAVSQKTFTVARTKTAFKEIIIKYFDELEKTLLKFDLIDKPHLIYNVDEKGVTICGKDETVTVLGCGNAAGSALPPFFIFPGQQMNDQLLEGSSPGTSGTVSKDGWSNSEIFMDFLRYHFKKFVPGEGHLLLLLDGDKSHIPIGTLEWARRHNIVLQLIPALTSHFLLPLDVNCYGPFQNEYNSMCHETIRTKQCALSLNDVCFLAYKAYGSALSANNLLSGFRNTGVYPFTKDFINDMPLILSKACNSDTAKNENQLENLIDLKLVNRANEREGFTDIHEVS